MRRAQSVRHNPRPSLALASDDLGVLREGDESNEDVLRKQLLERDRECDRWRMQAEGLKEQLAKRPSVEAVEELRREYREQEIILQGTLRENEKCIAEADRRQARIVQLERALASVMGENWEEKLELEASTIARSTTMRKRQSMQPTPIATPPMPSSVSPPVDQQSDQPQASLQQIRMLILGMEKRLESRTEQLEQEISCADAEGRRYKELAASAA